MPLVLLKKRLVEWEGRDLKRKRTVFPVANTINFCSNDYLAMRQHPQVRRAFSEGARKYGFGSGASALVCGYHSLHATLERQFAEFLQRDRAILFNSGYHANIGVITSLANRDCQIFLDRANHASIIDGVLLSRAKYRRYAHNNMVQLENWLSMNAARHTLIISESTFSMEGDLAPVHALADVATRYGSMLIIDDAHGIGVLGRYGRGICEQAQLSQIQVPVLIAPLGKAFGGLGAVVAGSDELIEGFIQFSRTYRYTTALPPAIAYAILQVLKIIVSETWRRERLYELIQFFVAEAKKRSLTLANNTPMPIQTILVRDNRRVMLMQQWLSVNGFAVAAIRPPTVPENTARLRISLSCAHTEKQIIRLLDLLSEYRDDS